MHTPGFDRRRAERFAQLLDEADGGRRHHTRSTVDDELAGLVALGHRARALQPSPDVDPEFRIGLRAMLIATAVREGIGATAEPEPTTVEPMPVHPVAEPSGPRWLCPRRISRPVCTRMAIAVGFLTGAVAVSSISAASGNAVPGDALYGMKRSTERAQLALANSDLSRGQLFLDFARTRLGEAAVIRGDAVGFASVLDDMDADTSHGARLLTSSAVRRRDQAALDVIEKFLADQRGRMVDLAGSAGRAERERADSSIALLDSIRKRAQLLRAALVCGAEPSIRTDILGPLPRACASERSGPNGNVNPPSDGHRPDVQRPGQGQPDKSEPGVPQSELPTGSVGDPTGKLTRPADNKPDSRPAGGRQVE